MALPAYHGKAVLSHRGRGGPTGSLASKTLSLALSRRERGFEKHLTLSAFLL